MEVIRLTLKPLTGLTKAQRKFYFDVLEHESIEIRGTNTRTFEKLKEMDLLVSITTDSNHCYAEIPSIKFFIKIATNSFDAALNTICTQETLIAPDFFTAFLFSLDKWKEKLRGVEYFDIAD